MFERQLPASTFYTPENKPSLIQRLDKLEAEVRAELQRQGFSGKRVHTERMLNMRFDGTDTALMVLVTEEDSKVNGEPEDFLTAFRRTYKNEFGFLLDTKKIIVDDIKVTVTPLHCLFIHLSYIHRSVHSTERACASADAAGLES